MAFLDHLERSRHNSVRSRNARLAALCSFRSSRAHRDVSSLQVIEHALGVPAKRFERPMPTICPGKMLAVIGAPDGTWFEPTNRVYPTRAWPPVSAWRLPRGISLVESNRRSGGDTGDSTRGSSTLDRARQGPGISGSPLPAQRSGPSP